MSSARSRSSTNAFCFWCGAANAPSLCSCKQVGFCNSACAKAAWPSHKLVCTFEKTASLSSSSSRKKSGKRLFSFGDIVTIDGLDNESQSSLNGLSAEVQSYNKTTNLYAVLLSVKDPYHRIESVHVKEANLRLKHTATAAALRSKEVTRQFSNVIAREDRTTLFNHRVAVATAMAEWNILPPHETVHRIKSGDESFRHAFFQAVLQGLVPRDTTLALLANGLVDACLADFAFPYCIDGDVHKPAEEVDFPATESTPFDMLVTLSTILEVGELPSEELATRYRVEVCQKIAPLILLVSTQKRRLFGVTMLWRGLLGAFVSLVSTCCGVPGREVPEALYSLPRAAVSAMLQNLVFSLTVDVNAFSDTAQAALTTQDTPHTSKLFLAFVLVVAAALVADVGESRVKEFGLMRIPAGARGGVGRTFASCILDVTARVCVEIMEHSLDESFLLTMCEDILFRSRHICRAFFMVPALEAEMEGFDVDFAGLRTPAEFVAWSRRRMATSQLK